ncbi:MAG: sigma-70 family RNA polymerase sigma factor [Planctomycetales bacterium]|nr:sigma-70 family RNA polymerase sigma factor [Planctomycetales bacterium]
MNIADLIEKARGADADALDELLTTYRNYLRVTAQIWLPDQLPARIDASDLVQETLLKAHERFGQFRGRSEAELTVWLRKILSRCLVDFVRHHQSAGRNVAREVPVQGELNSGDALGALVIASATSPSAQAERRELSVLLADELAQMPEHYREVILLRSIKERQWNEIAERMSREIGTVRALWVRALNELRNRMNHYL